MEELSEDGKLDRFVLNRLFEKRKINDLTKQGFFYFEVSPYMVASGKETYVIVSKDMAWN